MDLYNDMPPALRKLCGTSVTSEQEVDSLWNGHHHDLAELTTNLPETLANCMHTATLLDSEDMILEIIDHVFNLQSHHSPVGRGDDCAAIICSEQGLSISTDFFLEDIHFRTSYFTPVEAGAKALARATSDLAATGATPLGFTLGLMLPEKINPPAVLQIIHGMKAVSDAFGLALVGGDISMTPTLGFSITVWGEHKNGIIPLKRKIATPGNTIFAVGRLGLARLGLLTLEKSGRTGITHYPSCVMAHLLPRPLIRQGLILAEMATLASTQEPVIGLMDVSDGMARDLPRLIGNFGAKITLEKTHPEIQHAALEHDFDPKEFAYVGGEDYALLGTCRAELLQAVLEQTPHALCLGEVTELPKILLNDKLFTQKGFDHFAKQAENPIDHDESTKNKEHGIALLKNYNDKLQNIITVCSKANSASLMAGFNGNASIRDASSNTACIITASGGIKGDLKSSDFAIISLEKSATENLECHLFPHLSPTCLTGHKPSSEGLMHLAVYYARPDAKAILHTHPPKMLALNLILPPEKRMQLPLVESKVHAKKLGYVPDLEAGSIELAMAVAEKSKNFTAVWMENHGLVVSAQTLEQALALTEELEQMANIQFLSLLAK